MHGRKCGWAGKEAQTKANTPKRYAKRNSNSACGKVVGRYSIRNFENKNKGTTTKETDDKKASQKGRPNKCPSEGL